MSLGSAIGPSEEEIDEAIADALAAANVVQPFRANFEDLADYATNSTTMAPSATLQFTVPRTNLYKMEFHFAATMNSISQDFLGRFTVDNAIVWGVTQEMKDSAGTGANATNINNPGQTLNTGTNQSIPLSGFVVRELTAGQHQVQILIATGQNGVVAGVLNQRITVEEFQVT